ncbi:hypothetical protein TNCV_3723911 [Trichonephila clavipes]|nr:hypothetical protein TNCV_3723911 [Trichonephila clavipes]
MRCHVVRSHYLETTFGIEQAQYSAILEKPCEGSDPCDSPVEVCEGGSEYYHRTIQASYSIRVSHQTNHLTGKSAQAPQGRMSRILRWERWREASVISIEEVETDHAKAEPERMHIIHD